MCPCGPADPESPGSLESENKDRTLQTGRLNIENEVIDNNILFRMKVKKLIILPVLVK